MVAIAVFVVISLSLLVVLVWCFYMMFISLPPLMKFEKKALTSKVDTSGIVRKGSAAEHGAFIGEAIVIIFRIAIGFFILAGLVGLLLFGIRQL